MTVCPKFGLIKSCAAAVGGHDCIYPAAHPIHRYLPTVIFYMIRHGEMPEQSTDWCQWAIFCDGISAETLRDTGTPI